MKPGVKFLALFMAVAMVMVSGIFVTTQSFKATDDESYEEETTEEIEDVVEEIMAGKIPDSKTQVSILRVYHMLQTGKL